MKRLENKEHLAIALMSGKVAQSTLALFDVQYAELALRVLQDAEESFKILRDLVMKSQP